METYELTVSDHPGALAHVVALVAGRRWRLGSLEYPAAGPGDRRRLILTLETGAKEDQVEAQFQKLYDVLAVRRTGGDTA